MYAQTSLLLNHFVFDAFGTFPPHGGWHPSETMWRVLISSSYDYPTINITCDCVARLHVGGVAELLRRQARAKTTNKSLAFEAHSTEGLTEVENGFAWRPRNFLSLLLKNVSIENATIDATEEMVGDNYIWATSQ